MRMNWPNVIVFVKYALPLLISETRFTNSTSARSRASMNVLIMMPERAAVRDFLERLRDDRRVEAHRVLVDLPVRHRERARLAVGDHDDLPHVLLLREQNAARQLQPLGGVRVVRADLRVRERRQRDLLGRVVEEHDANRVAGELRANEVRERERDLLGRVNRSSPYRIIECDVSSMSTVAHDDRYSACRTIKSEYSRSIGTPIVPVRASEFLSVSLTSRFSTSPNSYCLLHPSDSMPVAR